MPDLISDRVASDERVGARREGPAKLRRLSMRLQSHQDLDQFGGDSLDARSQFGLQVEDRFVLARRGRFPLLKAVLLNSSGGGDLGDDDTTRPVSVQTSRLGIIYESFNQRTLSFSVLYG